MKYNIILIRCFPFLFICFFNISVGFAETNLNNSEKDTTRSQKENKKFHITLLYEVNIAASSSTTIGIKLSYDISSKLILGVYGSRGDNIGHRYSSSDMHDDFPYNINYGHYIRTKRKFGLLYIKYAFSSRKRLSPYIGIGAGRVWGTIHYEANASTHDESHTVSHKEYSTERKFLYYPFVGLEFFRNKPISFGLEIGNVNGAGEVTREHPWKSQYKEIKDASLTFDSVTVSLFLRF